MSDLTSAGEVFQFEGFGVFGSVALSTGDFVDDVGFTGFPSAIMSLELNGDCNGANDPCIAGVEGVDAEKLMANAFRLLI